MLIELSQMNYTSGLINYWPFGGSLKDVVGGKDLLIQLNGAFSQDNFGKNQSALWLNSGYALAPAGIYFDCTTYGYTIMLWIKLITFGSGNLRILSFYNSGYANRVYIYYSASSGELKINGITSNFFLNLGTWTHITVTANANTNVIYVNGQQTNYGESSCGTGVKRTFCNIGRSETYPGDTDLNAFLDELKIFNRPLSPIEVTAEIQVSQPYQIITANLINIFAPPVAYTSGLTNYWPFSGNTIDVVGGMNLAIQSNGQYDLDRFGNSNSTLYLNQGWAIAPAGLYFNCNIGYTIMLWVKLIAMGSGNPRLFNFFNSPYNNRVLIVYEPSTGKIGTMSGWSTSNIYLTTGIWKHVALTSNSTTNIIYINGQQVFSSSYACSAAAVPTNQCYIGRSDCYPGDSDINAAYDELKIFNRTLTAGQITAEMQQIEPYNKIILN